MNTKTTPKDFFLHVGATIALYVSVIALINLAFEIINRLLPDQLNNYFSVGSIVWPISLLVVLVPILYYLEWIIARGIVGVSDKKDIWIRKWRIYLTLFLTGATIAGDVITLINTYLNGEISTRFVLKVLILLFICSTVFKYYFFSINESVRWTKLVKKTVPWFGVIITLVVIIGGFIIVGSPAQQRAIRFDEQRISDLTNIQYQIVNYWQKKGKVPLAIDYLIDPLAGFTVPVDPETGKSYIYMDGWETEVPRGENSFELCATFSTDSFPVHPTSEGLTYPTTSSSNATNNNWSHGIGYVCFTRTIDPTLYPPVNMGK